MNENKYRHVSLLLALLVAVLGAGSAFLYRGYVSEKKDLKKVFIKEEQSKLDIKAAQIEAAMKQIYQGARTIALLPGIRSLSGGNLPAGYPNKYDTSRFSVDTQLTVQQIYNNLAANVSVSEVYAVLDGFRPDRGETPFFMYDELIVGGAGGHGGEAHEEHGGDEPEEFEGAEYTYYIKQLEDFRSAYPAFTQSFAEDIGTIPQLISPVMRTCDNTQYTSESKGDVRNAEGVLFSVPVYSATGTQPLIGLISVIVRANVFEAILIDRPIVPVTGADMERMKREGWGMPEQPADFILGNESYGIAIFDRRNKDLPDKARKALAGADRDMVMKKKLSTGSTKQWELTYMANTALLGARNAVQMKFFALKLAGFWLAAIGTFSVLIFLGAQGKSLRKIKALGDEISADKKVLEDNVAQLLSVVSRAAEGDLAARAETCGGSEEIAQLTDGINTMLESTERSREALEKSRAALKTCIGEVQAVLDGVSRGDYSLSAAAKHGDAAMDSLCASVNETVAGLARAIGEMKDYRVYLESNIARLLEVMAAVSDGDMTLRAGAERDDEIGRLIEAVNASISNLDSMLLRTAGLVRSVRDTAEMIAESAAKSSESTAASAATLEELASAMDALAKQSSDISEQTDSQSSAITQVSSSLESLYASVKMSETAVDETTELSNESAASARKGGEIIKSLNVAMREIMESSEEINNIIDTVGDFAEQTNLLSLNAAIEAARAGSHGLGFAVVADEVRKLAENSGRAAKEIASLIKKSVKSIEAGSKAAVQVETGIGEIVEKTAEGDRKMMLIRNSIDEQSAAMEQVAGAIEQLNSLAGRISSAAADQTRGAEEINAALASLNNAVQQTAMLASETAAAGDNLRSRADTLGELVSAFKTSPEKPGSKGLALL